MKNEEMWTTKDGKKILISEMEDGHLLNAMYLMHRRYVILFEEAQKRGLFKEEEPSCYEDIVSEDCSLPPWMD